MKKQFIVAFKDRSGNVEIWKFPTKKSMQLFCAELRERGLEFIFTGDKT